MNWRVTLRDSYKKEDKGKKIEELFDSQDLTRTFKRKGSDPPSERERLEA